METFLKHIGLEDSVTIFSEHRIDIDQLTQLTETQISQLLPRIGDRLRLVAGIQMKKRKINDDETQLKRARHFQAELHSSGGRSDSLAKKRKPKNDPTKKEFIIKLLNSNKNVTAELCRLATEIIKSHAPSFFRKNHHRQSEWQLIDFEEGTINCPFCITVFKPQVRQDSQKIKWSIHNLKRHLTRFHASTKNSKVKAHGGDDESSEENFLFEPSQLLELSHGDPSVALVRIDGQSPASNYIDGTTEAIKDLAPNTSAEIDDSSIAMVRIDGQWPAPNCIDETTEVIEELAPNTGAEIDDPSVALVRIEGQWPAPNYIDETPEAIEELAPNAGAEINYPSVALVRIDGQWPAPNCIDETTEAIEVQ